MSAGPLSTAILGDEAHIQAVADVLDGKLVPPYDSYEVACLVLDALDVSKAVER